MYIRSASSILVLLFSISAFSQTDARSAAYKRYTELQAETALLTKQLLTVETADQKAAKAEGCNAIRLLPRETYDGTIPIRGGGAYYSFARNEQEYGSGSDIELSRHTFSVGFAGADYGFISDLGDVDLSAVDTDIPRVAELTKYRPPIDESDVRAEYRRSARGETEATLGRQNVAEIIGHTYLLRSVNISRSDVLVALRVVREDVDGSVVLYWKMIGNYAKPLMRRLGENAR